MRKTSFLAAFLLSAIVTAPNVQAMEIEPFRSANRSPVIQIYGLPSETSSHLLPAGKLQLGLTQDIASIHSQSSNGNEEILLDGELYRWNIAARYSLTDKIELGMEIPFVMQDGGFLDGFIVDWHRAFGLSQGGRDTSPKNRLVYQYKKDGQTKLDMRDDSGGIGDISLLAAYKLYDQQTDSDHDTLAVRTQLKLPSGNSKKLLGSGGTDLALFLSGAMNRTTNYGILGLYGSAGGLFTADGDVLKKQRNNWVGFGNVGLGWSPAHWIGFKVQCDMHSKFYKQSSLDELGKFATSMTFGGTLKFPGNYLLDIGVAEDIAVDTAPDVTFHLGLTKRF
ncbi:MAG: DUF3187 family protein [Trichlorobacter sp.]|nr:DUF3187 family protein [Trichlorobacter sp.]